MENGYRVYLSYFGVSVDCWGSSAKSIVRSRKPQDPPEVVEVDFE
jgi:hypothetical protein